MFRRVKARMTARLRDCETAKQMYSGVACRCGRSRARLRARSIDALMRVRMIFSPRKTEAYASSSSSVCLSVHFVQKSKLFYAHL